jgi:hypothetical protein
MDRSNCDRSAGEMPGAEGKLSVIEKGSNGPDFGCSAAVD